MSAGPVRTGHPVRVLRQIRAQQADLRSDQDVRSVRRNALSYTLTQDSVIIQEQNQRYIQHRDGRRRVGYCVDADGFVEFFILAAAHGEYELLEAMARDAAAIWSDTPFACDKCGETAMVREAACPPR